MTREFTNFVRQALAGRNSAAARVFAEKGYHRASTPDICVRAKVSNGALYKYFRNKEAIYISVLNHGIDLMTEMFRKYTDESESFFEAIEALFDGLRRNLGRPVFLLHEPIRCGSIRKGGNRRQEALPWIDREGKG